MREVIEETEPEFLKLAEDLNHLAVCGSKLGEGISDHVNSVREAFEKTGLTGSDSLVSRAVDGLERGLGEVSAGLKSLTSIGRGLGQLRKQVPGLERIATSLQACVCGFAVESARTSASQQAFGTFVEELRQLAGEIQSVGEAIGGQAKSSQDDLEPLIRHIEASLLELRQLTDRSGATARATSERMKQLLDGYWSALQQAEARARQIARHAGDAAFHIQFGDIVRQKLEHVETALGQVAGILVQRDTTHATQALAVQGGQLDMVCQEVSSAHERLSLAFTGMAEETSHMVKSLGSMQGLDSGETDEADALESLKADLGALDGLQARGRDLCEQARHTSNEAMATTSRISQHLDRVKEMNFRIHLQALNAIVKTELLGADGITLGVLSMHVHAMSQESSALVDKVTVILNGITESTTKAGEEAGAASESQAALRGGMAEVGRLQEELRTRIGEAAALGAEQSDRLARGRESLQFLLKLEERAARLARHLAEFRLELAPAQESSAAQDHLHEISQRYTMESERAVHRRLTNESLSTTGGEEAELFPDEEASAGLALAAPAGGNDESFGDNVDLF